MRRLLHALGFGSLFVFGIESRSATHQIQNQSYTRQNCEHDGCHCPPPAAPPGPNASMNLMTAGPSVTT